MDTMSKNKFARLHGEKLCKELVEHETKDGDEDVYEIAFFHKKIEGVIKKFPEVNSEASLDSRVSFLIFRRNYIKAFGLPEWKRLHRLMKLYFDQIRQYSQLIRQV